MKKSSVQTAVVFAACLVGVGVIRHFTVEASNHKSTPAYVSEVKEESTKETVEIAEEAVPMADEVSEAKEEVSTPHRSGGSAVVVKPTAVYSPTLGTPSTDHFSDALGFAVNRGKAKWNLTKAALGYAYQLHNTKEEVEDQLKKLAIHTVVEHVATSDRLNTIVTIIGTVDEVHDTIKHDVEVIKKDVDSISAHIEERHDEIADAVNHIEERHDEIKENVEEIVEHVEERHDEMVDHVGDVVDHIEERHDEIEEHVDSVVGHIEEGHDKVEDFIDGLVGNN